MECACEGHEFVWSLHAPVIIFERMRSGLPGGSANSRCAVNLASSSRMGHGIPEASRARLYASSSMRVSIQTPSHGLRSLGGFEGLGIPRSSSTPSSRESARSAPAEVRERQRRHHGAKHSFADLRTYLCVSPRIIFLAAKTAQT